MAFVALEISLDVVSAVRVPLGRIARVDGKLADQLRTAITSVSLNLAEGAARKGADRVQRYRIARGSFLEARTALDVAARLGYLAPDESAAIEPLADRLGGLLWGLTK